MNVYSFIEQARKSNIEWLPYGEKVVKFYYHLKCLFLLYEMKKGFQGDEKGGTENQKSFIFRHLHQIADTGPFSEEPGNGPRPFTGRRNALSYLQFFYDSGKVIVVIEEDLDLSSLSVTAN